MKGRIALAAVLLACIPAAGMGEADVVANAPAAVAYRAELLGMIRDARRIVVVEHSNPLDVVPVDGKAPAPRPQRVYGVRELDAAQRRFFQQRVAQVAPDLATWTTSCAFIEHHTVYFFPAAGAPATMDVCFECGDIEWTGKAKAVPLGMVGAMSDVVKHVGLSPERDWRALMTGIRAD